jgi:hypothetical protein
MYLSVYIYIYIYIYVLFVFTSCILPIDQGLPCVTCWCRSVAGRCWGSLPSQARELASEAAEWQDLLERKATTRALPGSPEADNSLLRWRLGLFKDALTLGFSYWACICMGAPLDELVCLPLTGGRRGEQHWEHFVHQSCDRFVGPCISSSGYRNSGL